MNPETQAFISSLRLALQVHNVDLQVTRFCSRTAPHTGTKFTFVGPPSEDENGLPERKIYLDVDDLVRVL